MNCKLAFDPCPERDSGGVQCEEPYGHEYDLFATPHRVSEHTIHHNLAGNGYTCEQVDKATREGRQLIKFQVVRLF
jgi:hypothetical protein